eukprot:CAMPEP_0119036256 /NCGR_PEP_ID=MMETSP1177-20130426/3841_1 /TAXON_ID=2985 /ORGANISM="Ochromonas sp, Strain CCMP1899" /LENGTH=140 /DNA_ID=CAMNT_0006995819 /DNA_START=170 /DNA_END=589 /DNA_ORIENTATION=-
MLEEDVVFHDILFQRAMRQDGDSVLGYKLRDVSSQALLVRLYAERIEAGREDIERQARANEIHGNSERGKDAKGYRREALEARAERDLWSLLDICTRSDLLKDLDNIECDESLSTAIAVLTERSSVSDVINTAYRSDERI